jgi:5'-deoxynucleotidase YfbR-like HD superfamily hydrolase
METLSPQIIEIRDQIIEKLNDLTLEECSKKLKELFNNETNEFYKLGNLAARIVTLKKRIDLILNETNDYDKNVINNGTRKTENIIENILDGKPLETLIQTDWVRVQIKETTEVNGVRFPAGIQIDVTSEDSIKMIEGGKAILLDDKELSD